MSDLREKIRVALEDAFQELMAASRLFTSDGDLNVATTYRKAAERKREVLEALALLPPSPDTASTSLVLGGNGSDSASGEAAADAATEGWRDIESAPIGKRLLMKWRPKDPNPHAECIIIARVSAYDVHENHIGYDAKPSMIWTDGGIHQPITHVTHWMRLPNPPPSNGALPRHGKPLSAATSAITPSLDREAVARVIEPLAWEMEGRATASPAIDHAYAQERALSLVKAETILTLKAPAIPSSTSAIQDLKEWLANPNNFDNHDYHLFNRIADELGVMPFSQTGELVEVNEHALARALAAARGYDPDGVTSTVGRKVWQDIADEIKPEETPPLPTGCAEGWGGMHDRRDRC